MSELIVNVSKRGEGWEGTVNLPGLQKTKLIRSDGKTVFNAFSGLKTVARQLANRFNAELVIERPVNRKKLVEV